MRKRVFLLLGIPKVFLVEKITGSLTKKLHHLSVSLELINI